MFPLIPALILLLLHGPANFDKLAETGRLPASLAVFRSGVGHIAPQDVARGNASRRALATLIAASGNRQLSEAFASMFVSGDVRPAPPVEVRHVEIEPRVVVLHGPPPPIPAGFSKFVRSRDGPAAA